LWQVCGFLCIRFVSELWMLYGVHFAMSNFSCERHWLHR
jgi:hypothetical protein